MRFISGHEAIAQGALDAGVNLFAASPEIPIIGLSDRMAEELPKRGGKFVQMEDAPACLGAAVGASAVGQKAMIATSGPGFAHVQELIGYASINHLPLVVLQVMTMGPSTGLPNLSMQGDIMQARWGCNGDYQIIALIPSSPKEAYELAIIAFNVSEKYRLPVIVLVDQITMEMREIVDFRDNPKLTHRLPPRHHFVLSGSPIGSDGMPTHDPKEIKDLNYQGINNWDSIDRIICQYEMDDANAAIISYGVTARAAKTAVKILRQRKQKVGLLKVTTLWPWPRDEILKIEKKIHKIVVAETNWGQMFKGLRGMCPTSIDIRSVIRLDGRLLTPKEIIDGITA
ncbi:MAG TPA: transketolase C-terminal domain-containing protein [Candidatus Omnitrophota bacterium]|nr:transketolase C-terminal domain-containing protein [Candidatus Omnitrophota bacterium]